MTELAGRYDLTCAAKDKDLRLVVEITLLKSVAEL